ncbi:MAG: LacI family DNA-binding transcriptional regulator [Bryobacteraceae bacterium]|jgi:LacI family transcriptional regulator
MKDVAGHAGVSMGTVSHVINGSAHVREPLRQRVLQTIRDLGYQPSQLARGLRRNQSNIAGMIVPDITNPFFTAVVRGAEDIFYQNGLRLLLCNTDNDPAKELAYWHDLQSYRTAGLILIPSVNSQMGSVHFERSFPVVCLDRLPKGWERDSIAVDNTAGAEAATSHLLSLGHRRIGVITGDMKLANAVNRLEGFRAAMRRADIEVEPEYIQEGRFNRLSGYEKMGVLLRLQPRPTAVFASNDLIALGVLAALRENGLRCPEDISLVGFDDLEFSEFTLPALTTVSQPGYQMGTKGAALLLKRVNGAADPPQHIVLPTELHLRQSTARPAGASSRLLSITEPRVIG